MGLITLIEHTELLADVVQAFHVQRGRDNGRTVGRTGRESLADGTDDGALSAIVAVVVVAHAIAGHQIGLVLDGPCPGEYLEGVLHAT